MTPESIRSKLLLAASLGIIGFAGFTYYRSPVNNASVAKSEPCPLAAQTAKRVAPFAKGEVAAVAIAQSPKLLPELDFTAPDGTKTSLAAFKGKTILLNLWATWCVPCRKKMPALDALQAKMGGTEFEVVAINIDQRNLDKPKNFLNEIGVKSLKYYSDPEANTFQSLKTVGKAFGMPTSLLISPEGCEIGTLAGPAEWQSDDAFALIGAALQK